MAKRTDLTIDIFPWLADRGLIEDPRDPDQRRKSVLWLKRNLGSVTLTSPKRGCYRAIEDELNAHFNKHLAAKKEVNTQKVQQAKVLNAANTVIKNENARRANEDLPAMTRDERAAFLAQESTKALIQSLLRNNTNGTTEKTKGR